MGRATPLVILFIQIKWRLFHNQLQVIKRYYTKKKFLLSDLLLFCAYFFSNPYRISRKFLQKKGAKNIHTYGEIPLTTLETVAHAFCIQPQDKWLELGSGRGRSCFWMAEVWGCNTKGIEWIPEFVQKASWIAKKIPSCKAEFQNIDMNQADFSTATVIYLSTTCMEAEEISFLLLSMDSLPLKSKVITISEPLDHPNYPCIQSIPVSFLWGKTGAYLHTKVQ
jgi:hypothetical protein